MTLCHSLKYRRERWDATVSDSTCLDEMVQTHMSSFLAKKLDNW